MENEITTLQPAALPVARELPMDSINQGTIAIEASRAIAEAQGKLVIAKRFPRDEVAAYGRAMAACQRKGLADKAFYSYPRGKETVSGPTIRFAEELARCYGNLDYGIKELSQDDGKSEMQAYAWDLETNVMSVQNFTNPHMREVTERDPVSGRRTTVNQRLTGLRDIYEINANMGARRLRARILAILPADYVEAAVAECKRTLAGKNDAPLVDRVKKMVAEFAKLGVTQAMLEKRLEHKAEAMTGEELADYVGVYNALRGGESKVADWFAPEKAEADLNQALAAETEGKAHE